MRRSACRPVVLSGVLGVFSLTAGWGCLSFPGAEPAPLRVADGVLAEYVVNGADHPSALAFAQDGRVFYTEKNTGRIRVIAEGTLLAEPFATVPVNYADDRGLLGIALHPEFEQNNRVYVFYTRSDTGQTTRDPQAVIDNRVVYFVADGNTAAGGEVFVVSLPASVGSRRVSGRIAFAADGKLLVALGDLTASGSAQDNAELVGKILRYNDDGTIPADNPVAGSAVYARGLREVRGLGLDPVNGTPFAVDRNDPAHHEVNRIQAGKNYGWPDVTGKASTTTQLEFAASNPDYVDPIIDTGADAAGVVGGSFNPSTRYGPNTRLHYFYGETYNRRVMRAELTSQRDAVANVAPFAVKFPGTITDVAFTPAGTLYVACKNAIFRLVPG